MCIRDLWKQIPWAHLCIKFNYLHHDDEVTRPTSFQWPAAVQWSGVDPPMWLPPKIIYEYSAGFLPAAGGVHNCLGNCYWYWFRIGVICEITFYLCLLRWPNPAGDKAVLKRFVCAPSGHFKWHTWVCEGLINTGKSDDPERKAESGKCITL